MVDSDNGTYVMPTETRQALDAYVKIYAPRDYECELVLCLGMLVVAGMPAFLIYIGTLGLVTYSVAQKNILKHGMVMCIDTWLCAFVMLQIEYRAQCTQKDVCNFPSLAWINWWIQYESTAFNNCRAAIGIYYVVWRRGFAHATALDFTAVGNKALRLLCLFFLAVPFSTTTPEQILYSQLPRYGVFVAVGIAVKMPEFMCSVQCISTCQELLVHMTRCVGIWSVWWPIINLAWAFLDACGCELTKNYNAWSTQTRMLLPGLAGGAPAGPAQIATEKNVKMITEKLGERILASPDFNAVGAKKRIRTKAAIWTWYETYCTVDDRKPVVADIDGILQRANFHVTADARLYFGIHDLERLGFFP